MHLLSTSANTRRLLESIEQVSKCLLMANRTIYRLVKHTNHPLKLNDLILVASKFKMNLEQMSLLAGLTPKAFTSKSKTSTLSNHASEIVMLLDLLYSIGKDVFDSDAPAFRKWLRIEIPVLDNNAPIDLLTSYLGIELVKKELLKDRVPLLSLFSQ